eukprot:m.31529 g.31529  ORF g.31529 m.31529 type:complete len:68 (+) comp5371_c0_seq1:224-427(+)
MISSLAPAAAAAERQLKMPLPTQLPDLEEKRPPFVGESRYIRSEPCPRVSMSVLMRRVSRQITVHTM